MAQTISRMTILVRNQDEAIAFYTTKLGFRLLEDTQVTAEKRWVVLAPPGVENGAIVLALANSPDQLKSVGFQTAGKVLAVLHTDSFESDVKKMIENGVNFIRGPIDAPWGKVVVFEDLYGNLWDLVGEG